MDYSELRKAAEAATPGPWKVASTGDHDYGVNPAYETKEGFSIAVNAGCGRMETDPHVQADREFIALANPATVVGLLDELAEAHIRIEEIRADRVRAVELALEKDTESHYLRRTVERYEAAIGAVRELHQPAERVHFEFVTIPGDDGKRWDWCHVCDNDWPCPTIKALDASVPSAVTEEEE